MLTHSYANISYSQDSISRFQFFPYPSVDLLVQVEMFKFSLRLFAFSPEDNSKIAGDILTTLTIPVS